MPVFILPTTVFKAAANKISNTYLSTFFTLTLEGSYSSCLYPTQTSNNYTSNLHHPNLPNTKKYSPNNLSKELAMHQLATFSRCHTAVDTEDFSCYLSTLHTFDIPS